jgi:hypothetical protein
MQSQLHYRRGSNTAIKHKLLLPSIFHKYLHLKILDPTDSYALYYVIHQLLTILRKCDDVDSRGSQPFFQTEG